MKKIYTLLFSALVASSSFAQSTDSGSKIKYGIKAGVNFASMTFTSEGLDVSPKSITSFHFGAIVDIAASEKISIQPGLMLNGKGFKLESGPIKSTLNLMYLEIPVNVVYKVDGIYFGAGPYAAYGISGKTKYKNSSDSSDDFEDDVKFGSNEDEIKSTDFGVNFLAGYQLNNGVNFGVGYGLGLSNISNDDTKSKNKLFSISVGYSF